MTTQQFWMKFKKQILEKLQEAYIARGMKPEKETILSIMKFIKEDIEKDLIDKDKIINNLEKLIREKDYLTYGLIYELIKKPCVKCKDIGAYITNGQSPQEVFCDCEAGVKRKKKYSRPFPKY